MALIKCPECGKEMSDRAECCPNCGMPLNKIKATTNPISQHKKNGVPKWVWILIIVGSLLIVGGIVFFCFLGESSNPEAVQEEEIAEITYPKITERGVEPFIVGASMYDISVKGDFYDTILLVKRYNAYMDGLILGMNMSEEELQKLKKESDGVTIDVEAYGYADVFKGNDTLMRVFYDEKAVINKIVVLSGCIQMQNGVHVGLSSTEMFEKFNAIFVTPASNNAELGEMGLGDDATFELPHQSKNISVKALYDKIDFNLMEQYENKKMESMDFCGYDTLPLEAVKGSSVRSIVINKR